MIAKCICIECIHYTGKRTCLAYPEIPLEIWQGGSHDKMIKGQKGDFVFSADKEKSK